MARVMNFNPGPACLPLPALEQARDELLDFRGSGMSVMEHSHRGKEYEAVQHEAKALLAEHLSLPAEYDILFLQGGASLQFAQIPMNFLHSGATADYVLNGVWGEKARSEAALVAHSVGARVRVAGTTAEGEGEEKSYRRVCRPDEVSIDPTAAYVHFTSNETIHGVQYGLDPSTPLLESKTVPLVCDMSSDFLWRPLDVRPFSLIYAGAQKNLGPSGVCILVGRKSFFQGCRKDGPQILRYDVAMAQDSMYNTPPTLAIYLVRNVLAWLKDQGGTAAMERRNLQKARVLYEAVDAFPDVYVCPVEKGSRSVMNAVFRLRSEEAEARFVAQAKAKGMVGLKGHRSVGGIRVSMYNAVEPSWVDALATFMADFARAG